MIRAYLAAVAIIALAGTAEAFQVYHSPADDGTSGSVCIPVGGSRVLNLWLDNGSAVATDPASAKCDGTGGSVAGDEVCMFDIHITADPNLTIDAFVPEPTADIVANPQVSELRFNGGDPLVGTLGPTRLGQLTVSATGVGSLTVAGTGVDTMLGANAIAGPLASSEADTDVDDLCDSEDPCASFANALPLPTPGGAGDENSDGIPTECQCGDFNQSGTYDNGDITKIFGCIPGSAFPTPPAECTAALAYGETNNTASYDNSDVTEVFGFVPGSSFPNGFPTSQVVCARRPEGTPVP